ncbi:RHS repeat-associated protein [Hydrogenispora ethanolica]|uniref:RHS repeat-associated protein n=1 Tax=Hydrogenispora ethanolica TaxID=1082276 RepID=A0A4R1QQD4_HYDET|nr:cellulose binding domain-containing protein [Hydrogenispora ethanolica]TCL54575.1 RHS repeat-associated protein [Hydrogenispora ethanolica]
MKGKSGAIILTILALFILLCIPASASGLTVIQTRNGLETDPNHPANYLVDQSPNTYWSLKSDATQGWAELDLDQPALIYGIKLSGNLGNDTALTIEYQVNERWVPFIAGTFTRLPADGLIDLSWDRVVSGAVRIRLNGSGASSSCLNEIEVLGQTAGSVFHSLKPKNITASSSTSPNTAAAFLCDGNTYTRWQTKEAATQGEVVFEFPAVATVKNIHLYFTSEAQGNFRLEAWKNNVWQSIATVSDQPEGWYRIDLANQNVVTDKIRLSVSGFSGILGGISEIEFWGWGAFPGTRRQAIGSQLPIAIAPSEGSSGAATPDGKLKILSSSANPSMITNSLQHNVKIFNASNQSIRLADIKLRYWYTNETKKRQIANLYWSNVGAQNITTQFVTVDNNVDADTYLELGFTGAAGSIAPGNYVEIKLGINANDWSNYNQQNDFSFNSATAYTENSKYGGYVAGNLSWGSEPGARPTVNQQSLNLQFEKTSLDHPTGSPVADGRLKILYQSANSNPNTNSIQASLKLFNTSLNPVDLATVKVRYWYTNETRQPQIANIYWSNIGAQKITTNFTVIDNQSGVADTCLEFGFTGGTLAPGASVEIKFGLNAKDWSGYNQANDYSFAAIAYDYYENPKITGTIAGQLSWGVEPGTQPTDIRADYRLELVFAGILTEPAVLELNGTGMTVKPSLTLRDRTIYSIPLSGAQLWEGTNFLRIRPFVHAVTLENAFIAYRYSGGEQTIPVLGSLNDGLLFTAADPASGEWQLERKMLIENALVFTGNGSNARLFAWMDENWVEFTNPEYSASWIQFNGPVTTDRIKLETTGPVAELRMNGSIATDQAPTVRIFRPNNGEELALSGWSSQELLGFVDNPKAVVDVNGIAARLNGHYFTVPLGKTGLQSGASAILTATARDPEGRKGSATVTAFLGKFADGSLDQPEGMVYTDQSTFTISGYINQPSQYRVTVNDAPVTVSGNRFLTTVMLQEGLNIIKVQFINAQNNAAKTFYRQVFRYSGTVRLTVLTPEKGSYLNTPAARVSGTVTGLYPMKVTVNGVPATVSGSAFAATASLNEGANLITVVATDAKGNHTEQKITVYRDTVAPAITDVIPANGKIFASATVDVTARISDQNSIWVTIAGQVVTGTEGVYRAQVHLPDGDRTIIITAQDAAGNIATYQVETLIDTVPPAAFTPAANPAGWTNQNKPTINFSTTDATSGVDHYEISLDGGETLASVTGSSYPFTAAIPDGEHTVRVKAVDRAGNATTAEVKVYIDTTPPAIPAGFEVISGINRAILKWQGEDPRGEIVGYRIKRMPVFAGDSVKELTRASDMSDLSQFVDQEVVAGARYTYAIQARDHGGNYSQDTATITVTVGVNSQTITPDGGTAKFDNCELTVSEGAIPAQSQIVVRQTSAALPDNSLYATQISPAYSFTLQDQSGAELETHFAGPVTLTIHYGDLQLPAGYEPEDVGIYWYNKVAGYWEKLDYARNDFIDKTIAVQLKHFSDYQVMASKYVSPSLDSYYHMGVSPFLAYFQDNVESVSPAGGSLTLNATDLKIPGRAGNGLMIQRIYDSASALQEGMIEGNSKTYRKIPVDMFGHGWSLGIPWIEETDKGKFIRLPQGQTVKIELDSGNRFEYHEGIHFVMQGTSHLRMNDGTQYQFDSSGRVIRQTDAGGKNEVKYEYNGREITRITDSVGHVIRFEYQTVGSRRVIAKITAGNRAVNYSYHPSGTLAEAYDPSNPDKDPGKRKTSYQYETHTLESGVSSKEENKIFSYTVNLLNAIVYPTGEKSTYTYELRNQEYREKIEKKKLFGLVKITNNVRFAGTKVLVQKHLVAGKETGYSYQMNNVVGSFEHGNFAPAFTYMLSCQVRGGDRVNRFNFQQIEGSSLVNIPGDASNYNGPLPVMNETTIGNNQPVEQILYQYDVPLRAVTQEEHYRGGLLAYRVTSQYDAWGNATYRSDGSRNLEESLTYHSHDLIKNLPQQLVRKNHNPLKNTTTAVTTTYQYDEQLGKPLTVTVNDGSGERVTRFTYDDQGNVKTKIEEFNDNLTTEIFYDDRYQAFPVKQIVYGVRDADGNRSDLVTEAGYDTETGLKQWEKDARGFITRYEYDPLNRVTRVTAPDDDGDDSNNPYREYIFHDDTNRCEFYNELRQKTLFQFDGLGRLTDVVKDSSLYPDGVRTSYHYNNLGQIDQVTDARGNVTAYVYDGLNRVVKVTYPGGASAALSYDDATNTVTVTDENGGVVIEQSDWANRLIRAKQYAAYQGATDIYTWQFVYDSLGNKLRQSDPQSGQTDQEFDALGLLRSVQMPAAPLMLPGAESPGEYRPVLSYEYNAAGFKTAEISANENAKGTADKNKTHYEYDQLGRLIQTSTGAKDVFTGQMVQSVTKNYYDGAGNKVKTVDANGGVWEYAYSARGYLLSATDPAGNTSRYRYDALGNKIAATDPRGDGTDGSFTTWYRYDDLNRLWKTILPDKTPGDPGDNPVIELTYDENGNKLTEKDPNGVVTSYTYTARNWVETVSQNGRLKAKYVYDAKGNQIEIRDALDHRTRKEYDSLGRVRKVTQEGTQQITETYRYDPLGNRTALTDGRNNTIEYTYNGLGQLTGVTDPLRNLTQYRYDPSGNQVQIIAPNQLVTRYRYDEMNRLAEQIDSLQHATRYSYDPAGNRRQVSDPRGTIWQYQYYPNNLVQRLELSGADGTHYEVEYTYDAAGNRIEARDSGNTVRYNYQDGMYQADPLNRLNAVERSFDGATYRTAYQYDKAGLLTRIRYPEAKEWLQYRYNELNQLSEVAGFTAPQGISYDANGALTRLTYANGVAASYQYDNNNRLSDYQVKLAGTALLTQRFTYDGANNITAIAENKANKTFDYDAANQLTRSITTGAFLEQEPTPGSYGLKVDDRLGASGMDFTPVLSGMMGLDYSASSIGIDFGTVAPGVKQLQLIPAKSAQTHRLVESSLDLYASTDNRTYRLIPRDGWEFAKDDRGVVTIRLKERLATRFLKVHVKFDDRDNRFTAKNKATFLNELAKILRVYQEATSRTEEFEYDAAGNRKLQRITLIQTAKYDSVYYAHSNLLKTDGKYAFEYDAAGNLVAKGNRFTIQGDKVTFTTAGDEVEYWQYEYDLLNRLIRVRKNGTMVSEYGYDPDGLRVVKKAKGETTHYIFEGTEPIFEKRIKQNQIRSYVYALGRHLARVDGAIGDTTAKEYFYHTDYLGSVRAVTDTAGKVVYNADYLPFGSRHGENGDFDEEHGFTGKEYDPDTGLYYFNARWYDSELGRFISADPAADPQNPNLYSYCGNNPVIRSDPSGQVFWEVLSALVVSYLYHAVEAGVNAYNNGGSFWEGFGYGMDHGSFQVSINFGNGQVPTVGRPKEPEISELYYPDEYVGDIDNSYIDISQMPNGPMLASNSFFVNMQAQEALKSFSKSYDRDAAVDYARKWARDPHNPNNKEYGNPDYQLRRGISRFLKGYWQDCTNFVSQVLYAGGIQQTKEWYFNIGKYDRWGSQNSRSSSWTVASDFGDWLRNKSDIVANEYQLHRGFNLSDVQQLSTQVKKGDLIGWSYDKNGKDIHHWGVITKVENGKIFYAGHTNPRLDSQFSMWTFEIFDQSAVIIHIKDVIP